MRKSKSSFRDKVTQDVQRQKKAESSFGYLSLPKNVSTFSPDPGSKVLMDIIPYTVTDPKHPDRNAEAEIAVPGELWYRRPFKIHRNVGSDNDTVVCLASIGAKCPICEHRAKRANAKDVEKEELDALRPSNRVLYVVIPIGIRKVEEVPHIMDISHYNFQKLLNEEVEEKEEYADFPSLDSGYTLRVRFDSKTVGNSKPYAEASRIDFEERDQQYDESILDDVPNLDKVLVIMDYETLKAKFFELDTDEATGDDDIATDDEERKPVRRGRKVQKEEDEEPEEEKKPTRRAPKEEESDYTWEQIEKKTMTGLVTLIQREELDIDNPDDFEPEELRVMVAKELGIKVPKTKPKEEEPEEEKKPMRRKAPAKKDEDDDDNKCPHGFRFGVDINKKEACDSCDVWDECREAKKRNA